MDATGGGGVEEEAAALMLSDFKTHSRSAIFELDELSDSQCYNKFRLYKSDIFELKEALMIFGAPNEAG